MSEIRGIERLEGRGITARITDRDLIYTGYRKFAEAIGYPDAVEYGRSGRLWERRYEEFEVLAKGLHGDYTDLYLYVIEGSGGERFLFGQDGLELSGSNESASDCSVDELEREAAVLIAKMREKAYAEGFAQGRFDSKMDEFTAALAGVGTPAREFLAKSREETAQEQRDKIVERAKADIENFKEDVDSLYYQGEAYVVPEEFLLEGHTGADAACAAEFIVNKKKRTIVALMRDATSRTLYARGIAKCMPDDCFNTHIGRAIALRRALGEEVPEEYLNAPQPTEVRVGDVVKAESDHAVCNNWGNGKVKRLERPCSNRGYYTEDGSYNLLDNARVIDDSREGE